MQIRVEKGGARVAVTGAIAEDADFRPLVAMIGAVKEIDLSGITRINSAGIRLWVRFARGLSGEAPIELVCCPVAFVAQAGMISNFLGNTVIKSLFVPYACDACAEHVEEHLFSLDDVLNGAHREPHPCSLCKEPLVIDVIESSYFGWLKFAGGR